MFSIPDLELYFFEKVDVVTLCWTGDNIERNYVKGHDDHCIYRWIEDLFEDRASILIETFMDR